MAAVGAAEAVAAAVAAAVVVAARAAYAVMLLFGISAFPEIAFFITPARELRDGGMLAGWMRR
jgi:hypothetical protein